MDSILVIQLRQLGDILLTTPCLRELRKAYPKAKITFLSHKMGRLVIDHSPHVDEHLTYSDDDSLLQQLSLLKKLRAQPFDLVLDFMGNPRSALLAWVSGGRKRVGFASVRQWAYHVVLPRSDSQRYIVQAKFALLEAVGLKPSDWSLVLPWNESHVAPTLVFGQANPDFLHAPVRVLLSPTHRREARRWPLATFAALANWLVRNWGASVVWLWGPGEEEEIDKVMALTQVPTLKAPKTSFREMAAFIANGDLFVGNSNGPSHVAVAVGTPSLQLHGPTDGRSWCPDTEIHQYLQADSMERLALDAVTHRLDLMKQLILQLAAQSRARGLKSSWQES